MRIAIRAVAGNQSLGVITFEQGKVSFSTKTAKTVFQSIKNKAAPVRILTDTRTIGVLKSWSNGYVITEVEK